MDQLYPIADQKPFIPDPSPFGVNEEGVAAPVAMPDFAIFARKCVSPCVQV